MCWLDFQISNVVLQSIRGRSRVFVEEGFDLRLSGLCVQLARLSQLAIAN